MVRNYSFLFCLLFVLIFQPLNIFAAEIQQVRSSTLLQIGDGNRSYTVKLSCLEVASSDEDAAVNFLRSELKRKRRVNLRPQGSNDGILLARVILVEREKDIGESLVQAGLANSSC